MTTACSVPRGDECKYGRKATETDPLSFADISEDRFDRQVEFDVIANGVKSWNFCRENCRLFA